MVPKLPSNPWRWRVGGYRSVGARDPHGQHLGLLTVAWSHCGKNSSENLKHIHFRTLPFLTAFHCFGCNLPGWKPEGRSAHMKTYCIISDSYSAKAVISRTERPCVMFQKQPPVFAQCGAICHVSGNNCLNFNHICDYQHRKASFLIFFYTSHCLPSGKCITCVSVKTFHKWCESRLKITEVRQKMISV